MSLLKTIVRLVMYCKTCLLHVYNQFIIITLNKNKHYYYFLNLSAKNETTIEKLKLDILKNIKFLKGYKINKF